MTLKQNSFSPSCDIAAEFDKWAMAGRGKTMAIGHRYATQQLLEDLALSKDSVVLDAGCGIGWLLNDLIGPHIAQGTGIDLSDQMVAIASSQCTLPHLNFLTADISDTTFENHSFSHIISVEAIYYTPQPIETLKEWYRISQSGGQLGLVIDLYRGNPASEYWVKALSITAHNLSTTEWQSLLSSAGWTNVVHRCISLPAQTTANDFSPSLYFPTYDTYRAYCEAGSLLFTAQKE
ncbi:MAG: methyltransferase domain-containing protein [Cyanobacteria bacterium P01_F01_bin.150]